MPVTKTTLVELPHNVSDIDGTLSGGPYQSMIGTSGGSLPAENFLATSTNNPTIVVPDTPSGTFYSNFFNSSQIPSYAAIRGVEVVATSITYNNSLRHSKIGTGATIVGLLVEVAKKFSAGKDPPEVPIIL
jgi:hypothetical protein